MTDTGITARYSSSSVRIEGTIASIGVLVGKLCAGSSFRLHLRKLDDPSPYEGFLDEVVFAVSHGPVSIHRDGQVLLVEGASEKLKNLGQEIESLLGARRLPAHTHIEYFPGHFYLHESAHPLVVVAVP